MLYLHYIEIQHASTTCIFQIFYVHECRGPGVHVPDHLTSDHCYTGQTGQFSQHSAVLLYLLYMNV